MEKIEKIFLPAWIYGGLIRIYQQSGWIAEVIVHGTR